MAADANNQRQTDLVLQSLEELPTLSPVAVRLLKAAGAHDADFDEICTLIEADPALSTKVLSLVRRAGTGAARNITTVKRAAVMLGLEALQSAVLSVQVYELLSQAPGADERRDLNLAHFDRVGFWKHSVAVACAAEAIARHARPVGVTPDEAFVAGLVHDLGKLALDWILPKTYDKVARHAQARAVPLHTAERAVIGIDHHQAGKRLAERWSLPHQLQDAMWLHGQPPGAMPDLPHRSLVGVVAVANGLAQRLHIGWSGGSSANADTLLNQWVTALEIDPVHLQKVHDTLHESVAERCRVLGIGEDTPATMVIESIVSANSRLSKLQEQVRTQTRAAAGAGRALALVSEFAAAERPGGTLNETLARIALGWNRLTGKGPLAVICQTRSGGSEPWRFLRCDDAGNVVETTAIPPPVTPAGEQLDLRQLSAGSLGNAFEMAQWLARRLGPTVPISKLGTATLPSAMGPCAVIVHEPVESMTVGHQALATITTVWAWAVGAATQSEGSRRLAEQLAQAARELSETQARLTESQSMARLGEFTSGAAHEMNNPLTVISGRAQLLADKLKDPKAREDAAAIVKAADALTDLVTQLHTVASPPRPKPLSVPLVDWAQGVLSDLRKRSAIPGSLSIKVDAPDEEAVFDGPQTAKATVELLSNAVQSQPKSGVTLRIAVTRSGEGSVTQQLRITVTDDGRGMSDFTRKHACDPFFSSLPAGRRQGLGLALAKRLIESNGGTLEIDSRPDKGTTATFALPLSGQQGAAQGADGPESGRLGRAA